LYAKSGGITIFDTICSHHQCEEGAPFYYVDRERRTYVSLCGQHDASGDEDVLIDMIQSGNLRVHTFSHNFSWLRPENIGTVRLDEEREIRRRKKAQKSRK
jgi:hypothetical protein